MKALACRREWGGRRGSGSRVVEDAGTPLSLESRAAAGDFARAQQ